PKANYDRTGATDTGGTYASATFTNATLSNTATVGTVGAATVTAVETGSGAYHQTVLTLTNLAMSLNQTHVGGGSLIYTFPKGNISVIGARASVAETTTSAILTTLNGGKNL